MKIRAGLIGFAFFVACAAVFVWVTSHRLPELVASHFGGGGGANGFMPRTFYVRFMIAFVIGLPALLVAVTSFALGRPNARITIPDRGYWLAPERRAETIAFLRSGVVGFGVLLLTFLCYTHWLVVQANQSQPAQLAESWFLAGLVAFFAGLIALLWTIYVHFRRAR